MIAVLLMAGRGQRFAEAGYAMPKPMLPMRDGIPLLLHVVSNLPRADRLVTVARYLDKDALFGTLCALRNVDGYNLHQAWLHYETEGPLESAMVVEHLLKYNSDELLLAYCDVLLHGGAADVLEAWHSSGCEMGAVGFPSSEERFGYWEGDKCVTTPTHLPGIALSGLFYWRSASAFCNEVHKGVWRVGAGIVDVLRPGTHVAQLPAERILDVGVPAAYEAYLRVPLGE